MDALVALFRERRPEVVVANQVEAAPAIRAALLEAGVDALVVGYCHYLPFSFSDGGGLELDPAMDDRGLGRSVLLAFAAGLAACDRVLVHSSTAASWTTAAAARTGVDLGDKLHIVPAPRDVRLVRDPAGITRPTAGPPASTTTASTGITAPPASPSWPAVSSPAARCG
ncbi:hypothetical protein [Streptomyces sp. C8S0]|uniref:hypothetical protein n=1 Tax=Streptomyces sp. C8S0 TaxID=2585716 RepID=UPI001D03A2A3|nr:hypothetical protein [Streptomyces sp. C8S0]